LARRFSCCRGRERPIQPPGKIRFPSPNPRFRRSVLAGLFWGGLLAGTALAAAPEIRCGLDAGDGIHRSTDGVVDLAWTRDGASLYQLEEQSPGAPDFEHRYAGPDASTVRSGLAEGIHRFRVRGLDALGNPGPWSEALVVEVAYMDRGKVRLLLVLGATVVIATVVVIVHGHLSHRRASAG
jgi:hypothetical protein